jgi:hypothetical protein
MKPLLLIASIFLASSQLPAQEIHEAARQQMEDLATEAEEGKEDDLAMSSQWEHFRKHPLDLNEAGEDELRSLGSLSALQVHHFLRYRVLLGKLLSVYEFQAVPFWDLATIKRLLPYIRVDNTGAFGEGLAVAARKAEKQLFFRASRVLEKARGYGQESNGYLGDRNHLLLQFRARYKSLLQYGFTAEKDAGEQFFKGRSKGFDFYSFHFFAAQQGRIQTLTLGDFAVNMGQGLIQWNSMGFQKSSEVMAVKREAPVLLPYRSAGEFYFNRGAGITLKQGRAEATFFASARKAGATISDGSTGSFTAFHTSGYHRTASETAKKNNTGILSAGMVFKYRGNAADVGLNAVVHRFGGRLEDGGEPYNKFRLSGRQWYNISLDYSHTYRNLHLFGELAMAPGLYPALVQGCLLAVDPKVDISLVYRNIHPRYQSLFGNAFTDNAAPSNEEGLFTGIIIRPAQRWQLNAYADIYRFPWLRYRVDAPGGGRDYLVQLVFQPDRRSELYLRYKSSSRGGNEEGGPTNYVTDHALRNLRLHLSAKLSRLAELRCRFELSWYEEEQESEEGFTGFIEGRMELPRGAAANLRLQYFETGTHNRFYAYESDVLYGSGTRVFSGKGFRYYLNFTYDISRKISLWIRWAQFLYPGQDQTGSGMELIPVRHKTETRMQIRYDF